VAQVLQGGDVLEIGAGSGKLAADLLLELERLGALPASYAILELSPDLQARQRALLAERAPHLLVRVRWLDQLPETFSGVMLGNEVLDAMPVHIVAKRGDSWLERGVAINEQGLVWEERPIANPALADALAKLDVPDGYITEINLAAPAFIASLATALQCGMMLFIDYGFPRVEFYHPQRHRGTLMCHYRHHAHDDPFLYPGLQDITAHVDFTAIAEAAVEHGLDVLGYATQAHFLLNCGLTELLARTAPDDTAAYLPLTNQVQRLTSPAEMGELFKVIALGKSVDETLIGFARGDQRHRL
jgi:SAM-dependent MidA family methyltransferase